MTNPESSVVAGGKKRKIFPARSIFTTEKNESVPTTSGDTDEYLGENQIGDIADKTSGSGEIEKSKIGESKIPDDSEQSEMEKGFVPPSKIGESKIAKFSKPFSSNVLARDDTLKPDPQVPKLSFKQTYLTLPSWNRDSATKCKDNATLPIRIPSPESSVDIVIPEFVRSAHATELHKVLIPSMATAGMFAEFRIKFIEMLLENIDKHSEKVELLTKTIDDYKWKQIGFAVFAFVYILSRCFVPSYPRWFCSDEITYKKVCFFIDDMVSVSSGLVAVAFVCWMVSIESAMAVVAMLFFLHFSRASQWRKER